MVDEALEKVVCERVHGKMVCVKVYEETICERVREETICERVHEETVTKVWFMNRGSVRWWLMKEEFIRGGGQRDVVDEVVVMMGCS